MHEFYYQVADWGFKMESDRLEPDFLYNYAPFRKQEEDISFLLFAVNFKECPAIKGKLTRCFEEDTQTLYIYINKEECNVVAYSKESGRKYQFRAYGQWTNIEMNLSFEHEEEYRILDQFLMLAFIYSSALRGTILIHASCIRLEKSGVAFLGHSGVGKSTHSHLWLEHILGASLLNDDQPAVRLINGVPYLYGTPWSGKTPCYENEKVRLNSLFLMKQADRNEIRLLSPFVAFQRLLASCSLMQEERMTFNSIVETVVVIAEGVSVYELNNKPEREAVELAYAHSLGKK